MPICFFSRRYVIALVMQGQEFELFVVFTVFRCRFVLGMFAMVKVRFHSQTTPPEAIGDKILMSRGQSRQVRKKCLLETLGLCVPRVAHKQCELG